MFLDAPNPTQIQFVPPRKRANPPPPLVLIHDGGGTTFSYFLLGNLHRDVWAIHNPKHGDDSVWEGGIDGMAKHYISLILKAGITGSIVLGGWSFGGYLSIAIARLLADDPSVNLRIAGFLIIDAPYHQSLSDDVLDEYETEQDGTPEPFFKGSSNPLMQKSFESTCLMLVYWDLPSWDAPVCHGRTLHVVLPQRSFILQQGDVLHKPVGGAWKPMKTSTHPPPTVDVEHPAAVPPAVMLRCTQPTRGVYDEFRNEKLLGWESKYPEFIKAVIDIDAEHYTVFDKFDSAKMKNLTLQVKDGLRILDNMQVFSETDHAVS